MAVPLDLETLPGPATFPLVARPRAGGVRDARELTAWMGEGRAWLEPRLVEAGAVLFRGFGFDGAASLEAAASAFAPEFMTYAGGKGPRPHIQGAVHLSTSASRLVPIPLHCELSYLPRYPRWLFFHCRIPPRERGQTPLADMGKVREALDPEVRERFETRGVRLVQTAPERKSRRAVKTWPELLATADREEAERTCRDLGMEFEWQEGGSLRLVNRTPAISRHPVTGEIVWFNQAHLQHDTWSEEFQRLGRGFLAAVMRRGERRRARRGGTRAYRSEYGDGSPIADADMRHVRRMLWEHAVRFDWERGDLLLVDNARMAHAREPYAGKREIQVTLNEPVAQTIAFPA